VAVSRVQVEMELRRILESEIFAGGKYAAAEKSGQLLAHIVLGTLDGKSLTQNALLIDFYGYDARDLDADRDDARIGVLRLRRKLDQYNAGPGIDDPITIEIPKGQYRAVFTENPSTPARKEIKLGFRHVNEETSLHSGKALNHFERAIELQPDSAEAWAGVASAYITLASDAFTDRLDARFARAEKAARKAIELDDLCWRAHANLGSLFLYRHEWLNADAVFETAGRIAPLEVAETADYGPYLLSRGNLTEARKLAHHYREEGFDDAVLLTRAGLILYLLRDFDEAKEILRRACDLSPNFWRCHLVLAFVHLSLGEADEALEEMEEARHCVRGGLWLGMEIMCLEAAGKSEKAEKNFQGLLQLRDAHYASPAQLGLAHLALGDSERAISFLSESCDAFDPFTAWLHLWPFLDPLRKHRAFRELLRRWDYPAV
jgi:tetratricopeptide (TPR) repeat protein